MIPIIRASFALLTIAVASLLMVPLQWLAVRFDWDLKDRLPRAWHRLVINMIGAKVTVNGSADAHRPLLVLANHTSWLDIPVIGSLAPLSFVASSMFKSSMALARLAPLQGTVFIDGKAEDEPSREAQRKHSKSMLVVFAEGTTNAGNNVLPFLDDKMSAAARLLAGDQPEIWVQPLSIAYTRLQGLPMGRQFRPVVAWTGTIRFLPHVWTLMCEYSVDAVVSFGEPIRYELGREPAAIARQAEDSVRKMTANVLTGRDPY